MRKFWRREPKNNMKEQDETPEDKLGKYNMQVISLLDRKGGLARCEKVKK